MEEDKIDIDALEDYANISKPLNTSVIEISSDEEEEPMYITTTSSHPRDRLKQKCKNFVMDLTFRLARGFDFVLSLGVTTPLITPVVSND